MPKKIHAEILELEELAAVLGMQYSSLRTSVARKLKNNEPLEFGKYGKYKLFGKRNKVWYAYNSEKYEINIISANSKAQY